MDQERERIQEDLRGLIRGDVRCDDLTVQLYATDASIHQVKPLGVICPRSLDDVVVVMQYAAEHRVSVHARGAGTGAAGQALGAGLVLDFSRHMRRVLRTEDNCVRVQPGVTRWQLNRHLAAFDLEFGAGPTDSEVTTVGGMIAVDAAGARRLRYGTAGDAVESLQVVLADGYVTELAQHDVPETSVSGIVGDRRQRLIQQVAQIVDNSRDLLARHRPRTAVNCAGYRLHDVLNDGNLHMARLMAGTEGTLGLITEATLCGRPRPAATGCVLLFFDRLENAARGAQVIAELGASACDLIDRRLLSIAREFDVRYESLIPLRAEAALLAEFDGDNAAEVWAQLQTTIARVQRHARLAFDSRLATDRDDVSLLRSVVRRAVSGVYRISRAGRPQPLLDDIAVPVPRLPEILVQLQNLFKTHAVTVVLYAHAGQGQLHMRPFLDFSQEGDVDRARELATAVYELVCAAGGTVSGEKGDGLSRSWYLRRQFGPAYRVFRQIKDVFDPDGILNPGKIVAPPMAHWTDTLRRETLPTTTPTEHRAELQLAWQADGILQTAISCHGCGACRGQEAAVRMCPIFRFAPREQAAPRAKANLWRALLTGQLKPESVHQDAVKALADLCVNCHQCRIECPTRVDIPKLVTECKAQYVVTNGLRPSEWLLARLDRVGHVGTMLHLPANWALQNRTMRWLLQRLLGIAQGRKLPQFAARSFLRSAHRRYPLKHHADAPRKVLFFVDVYANWFDTQLAHALVRILERHNIEVYVPSAQRQSGMAALSMGAVDIARRFAHHNLPLLSDAIRMGYEVVTTEPAAALCLQHEYPNLVDEEDAQLVAGHIHEACAYLWQLHQAGVLQLDLEPLALRVGYHQPCHVRALNVGMPTRQLLQLIPELAVDVIDQGCSGMAGTFGLRHRNYRSSLRAGWGLISTLRDPAIQLGCTECSSCKLQMEQGTVKPTVHPVKLLALAYGVMPEVADLIKTPGKELVST